MSFSTSSPALFTVSHPAILMVGKWLFHYDFDQNKTKHFLQIGFMSFYKEMYLIDYANPVLITGTLSLVSTLTARPCGAMQHIPGGWSPQGWD